MLNLLTKMVEPIQLLILLVDLYFSRKKTRKKLNLQQQQQKNVNKKLYIYQIQNLYTQLKMLCKQTADQMCAKKNVKRTYNIDAR